jgi:hypothetical protein
MAKYKYSFFIFLLLQISSVTLMASGLIDKYPCTLSGPNENLVWQELIRIRQKDKSEKLDGLFSGNILITMSRDCSVKKFNEFLKEFHACFKLHKYCPVAPPLAYPLASAQSTRVSQEWRANEGCDSEMKLIIRVPDAAYEKIKETASKIIKDSKNIKNPCIESAWVPHPVEWPG